MENIRATYARTESANRLKPVVNAYGMTFTANLFPATTTTVCYSMRAFALEAFMGDADARNEVT